MSPVSPNDPGVAPPSNLSKLNVSQLKALCKERRIVGYSKLGKAALLRKLAEHGSSTLFQSSAQSTLSQAQSDPLSSKSGQFSSCVDDTRVIATPTPAAWRTPALPQPEPATATTLVTHISQTGTVSRASASITTLQQCSPSLSGVQGEDCCSPVPVANAPISKRVYPELSRGQAQARPLAKKLKVAQADASASAVPTAGKSTRLSVSAYLASDHNVPVPPIFSLPGSALLPKPADVGRRGRTQSIATPGKRFKPLAIIRPPSKIPGNIKNAQVPLCLLRDESTRADALPTRLWYLDFPAPMEPPPLSPITLPPPLSQRGLIQRWAIALSCLSRKELIQCCLVSKLIRYAVYSSAYYKLSRYFYGRRLSVVLQECGTAVLMKDFWPYLRLREQEVSERKYTVMSSFLHSAFRGPNHLISAHLWASPDNEKQLTVALRFLLTRLWFALSTGVECGIGIRTNWFYDTITGVAEVVKSEIWRVTVRNLSGHLQVFHVLEATCEVLGLEGGTWGDEYLRSDWASYIEERKKSPEVRSPLCEAMRWADHAEYQQGISRHWLRRTEQMGMQGGALRTIAERYTLACIVGNSLSGSWMSAPQMAQEFAGLTQHKALPLSAKASNINLFLPAHHHVESIHLTTARGRLLHPALAVAQTSAREYYILRDNGLEVGCEEEGVASVWMRVLGCDARGEPVRQEGVNFEELRAYIQDLLCSP